jgi:alpha-tubulin suppressor-like RCC1 family protein
MPASAACCTTYENRFASRADVVGTGCRTLGSLVRWVAAFVVVIVGCKKQPPAPVVGEQEPGSVGDAAGKAAPITAKPIALVSGTDHDCALLEDGQVACWGSPLFGVLGPRQGEDGSVGLVPGVVKAKQLVAGERHTCALVARGAVKCWGENSSGELGVPGKEKEVVEPIASGATAIAAGSGHTCAIVGSAVKCWGENASHASAGADTSVDVESPREIEGLGPPATIALGGTTSCVRSGPSWQCWGSNIHHQLGLAEPLKSPRPLRVTAFDGFTAIALGDQIACRIASSGAVTCLGSSHDGRRGDGAKVAAKGPAQIGTIENEKQLEDWAKGQETREADEATPHELVGVKDVVEVAAGRVHACARRATGAVVCWGTNARGQLGDGTVDSRGEPVAVRGIDDAIAISVAWHHSCAIRKSGGVWCWGGGDDKAEPRLAPVRVAL